MQVSLLLYARQKNKRRDPNSKVFGSLLMKMQIPEFGIRSSGLFGSELVPQMYRSQNLYPLK